MRCNKCQWFQAEVSEGGSFPTFTMLAVTRRSEGKDRMWSLAEGTHKCSSLM